MIKALQIFTDMCAFAHKLETGDRLCPILEPFVFEWEQDKIQPVRR